MAPLEMRQVTEARRAVILAVVARGPVYYPALREALEKLHAQGKWPQAEWLHARNEPYDVGTRQHLAALVSKGKLMKVSEPNRFDLYQMPQPELLLPVGVDKTRVQSALDRYRHVYGLGAVAGVTHDMQRVIRVDTARGVVEHILDRYESWTEALGHAGLD